MRVTRPALCLAVAGSLLAGGVANAAVKKPVAKPVCNLITDVKGDGSTQVEGPVATSNDDRLDVLSADVAAGPKLITAVLRMAKADGTSPSPTGSHYDFLFNAPGATNQLYLEYFTGNPLLKAGFSYGYVDPTAGYTPLGKGDGVIDKAKNEVHITASLDGFDAKGAGPIKQKDKLSSLEVTTYSPDLIVLLPNADDAKSDRTYTVGQISCVTPGK